MWTPWGLCECVCDNMHMDMAPTPPPTPAIAVLSLDETEHRVSTVQVLKQGRHHTHAISVEFMLRALRGESANGPLQQRASPVLPQLGFYTAGFIRNLNPVDSSALAELHGNKQM